VDYDTNYKGQLIEYCHRKNWKNPTFTVLSVQGPEHEKVFRVRVRISSRHIYEANGKTKKEAEQNAAHYALNRLGVHV